MQVWVQHDFRVGCCSPFSSWLPSQSKMGVWLSNALHPIFLSHFPWYLKQVGQDLMCSTPLVYLKPILLTFQSSLAETHPLETGSWHGSLGCFSWDLLVWLFPGFSDPVPLCSLPDVRRVKDTWKRKLWTLPDFQQVSPKLFVFASPFFLPSRSPCEPTLRVACANKNNNIN